MRKRQPGGLTGGGLFAAGSKIATMVGLPKVACSAEPERCHETARTGHESLPRGPPDGPGVAKRSPLPQEVLIVSSTPRDTSTLRFVPPA